MGFLSWFFGSKAEETKTHEHVMPDKPWPRVDDDGNRVEGPLDEPHAEGSLEPSDPIEAARRAAMADSIRVLRSSYESRIHPQSLKVAHPHASISSRKREDEEDNEEAEMTAVLLAAGATAVMLSSKCAGSVESTSSFGGGDFGGGSSSGSWDSNDDSGDFGGGSDDSYSGSSSSSDH